MKFQDASEELSENVGLGSFSNFVCCYCCCWPVAPCTVCEWRLRILYIISQVGVPSGVVKSHSSTEQARGRGAMVNDYWSRLLDHVFRDIIESINDIYLGPNPLTYMVQVMLSEIMLL